MHASAHRIARGALVAALLPLVLAACGSSSKSKSSATTPTTNASPPTATGKGPGSGKPSVTLGAKNFTEEYVLGALYAQALQAKGFRVKLDSNIGSTEITDKALTSHQIDGYPEYTGTILTALAGKTASPSSAQAAYLQAKAFEGTRGYTLLNKTPFVDTDALASKPAYAAKHGLHAVGDLRKLGASATLGGPPEFQTRAQGLVGMRRVYGVAKLGFKPLAIGLQYQALDAGQVQLANVFTTDGQLQRGSYTVLKDPKNLFGFQNVAFVVSKAALRQEGPAFARIINAVSAKLTTAAMRRMNAAVDIDKQAPAAVAQQFLRANGLL